MSIKEIVSKVLQSYYKRKMRIKILLGMYAQVEENRLSQEYLTKRILEGQVNRREELLNKQREEKEIISIMNFIRKV